MQSLTLKCRVPSNLLRTEHRRHPSLSTRSVVVKAHRGVDEQGAEAVSRRQSLLMMLGGAVLSGLPQQASAADTASLTAYQDPVDKFTLAVPADWLAGEGQIAGNKGFSGASGARRTLAWFPSEGDARDVNVTVVVSNVSMEFTRLGSFGSVDTFASNLINSQDRSYMLRSPWGSKDNIQLASLVNAKEMNDGYLVEYTIQTPPQAARHLVSLVALQYNGTYNRLYTVTAQCLENDLARYKDTLQDIVKTFKVRSA